MNSSVMWAYIFGVVLVLVGILGFIPGITTSDGLLLGLFEVDATHNSVHFLTGVLALIAGFVSAQMARWYFMLFGVVYAVVAILGFFPSSSVLGLFGVNLADNLLHVAVALVALYLGFMMKEGVEHSMSGEMDMEGGQHQGAAM